MWTSLLLVNCISAPPSGTSVVTSSNVYWADPLWKVMRCCNPRALPFYVLFSENNLSSQNVLAASITGAFGVTHATLQDGTVAPPPPAFHSLPPHRFPSYHTDNSARCSFPNAHSFAPPPVRRNRSHANWERRCCRWRLGRPGYR